MNQGQNTKQNIDDSGNAVMKEQQSEKFVHQLKDLFIKTMGAMAQGLFATLLVGTILSTFGTQCHIPLFVEIGDYAKGATGYAMATAIGYSMSAPPLVLFSLLAVGGAANTLGGAGGPFAVLLVSILTTYIGCAVSQKTKFDIILTPIVTTGSGVLLSMALAPTIGGISSWLGLTILWATELQPFFMGVVLSVLIGMALTLPISSAAICAGLGLTGLAGGAGLVGCCAQMVGFATMSFKENGWGGLLSQGLGTSMLQMTNIMKNPMVWVPPTVTSAITGALSTTVFRLEMNGAAVSSGMGTCGLVGQIGVYTGWLAELEAGTRTAITAFDWLGLISLCFVLPALLTPVFYRIMKKMGYIKEGDLKLDR